LVSASVGQRGGVVCVSAASPSPIYFDG